MAVWDGTNERRYHTRSAGPGTNPQVKARAPRRAREADIFQSRSDLEYKAAVSCSDFFGPVGAAAKRRTTLADSPVPRSLGRGIPGSPKG
jgi:hypothetical protein